MTKYLKYLFLPCFLMIGCSLPSEETTTSNNDTNTSEITCSNSVVPNGFFKLEMSAPLTGHNLLKNEKVYLQAKGGKPPYSFKKLNIDEPGKVDSFGSGSGKYFFADTIIGNTTIEVRDSSPSNQAFCFKIQTNDFLHFENDNKKILIGQSVKLNALGGIPPYSYKYISGDGGVLDGDTFTAPLNTGSSILSVFDSRLNEKNITISFGNNLTINSISAIPVGASVRLSPSGGFPPYTFAVKNFIGSIDNLGNFSSSLIGQSQIEISDSESNKITTQINIVQSTLNVPSVLTVVRGETEQIAVSGGTPPYSYSIKTLPMPLGTVNNVGQYTAPGCAQLPCINTETVWVKDAAGTELGVDIIFNNQLSISPVAISINAGEEVVFSANGGTPSYSWKFSPNLGNILSQTSNGSSITYRAPSTQNQGQLSINVTVTDYKNRTYTSVLTVAVRPSISPKSYDLTMNNSMIFSVNSGVPPYTFEIQGSFGKMTQLDQTSSRLSFEPNQDVSSFSQITVIATDSRGIQDYATVNIYPRLTTDLEQSVAAGEKITISGQNGIPPYSLSYTNGTIYSSLIFNQVNPNVMEYSSQNIPRDGYEYLRITDSLSNFIDFRVKIVSPLIIEFDNLMTRKDQNFNQINFENYYKITAASKNITLEKNVPLGTYSTNPIQTTDFLYIENVENMKSCDRYKFHEFNKVLKPISSTMQNDNVNFLQKIGFNFELSGSSNQTATCLTDNPIVLSKMKSAIQSDLNTSCSSNFLNIFNLTKFSFGNIGLYCQVSPEISIKDSCSKYNSLNHNICEKTASNVFSFSKNGKSQGLYVDTTNLSDFTSKESISVSFWARIDFSQIRAKSNQNFKIREDASILSFDNGYRFSIVSRTENSIPSQAVNRICFTDNTTISNGLPCFGVYGEDPTHLEWTQNGVIKGRWTHFGIVFNKDYTKNKIYINGQEKYLISFNNSYLSQHSLSNKFKIGGNYNDNGFNIDGEIGSLKVYDKEVSPTIFLNDFEEKKIYFGF